MKTFVYPHICGKDTNVCLLMKSEMCGGLREVVKVWLGWNFGQTSYLPNQVGYEKPNTEGNVSGNIGT